MPDIGTMFRVGEILKKSIESNAIFRQSDQEHVDRIVRTVYKAVMNNRVKLAKMAVEETGLGNWRDKVLKTAVAAQFVYEYIKDRKTVGVISNDTDKGITEIVHPIGTVLGLVSETDPIASAVFKILIALKTRNSIILAPDEKAEKLTAVLCDLCYNAALSEDAPENCIQAFFNTGSDEFNSLIYDKRLAIIIGAGDDTLKDKSAGLGAPVIGTGRGNVPVYVTKTIDPLFAAKQIIASKNFDNGVMNSSEQAIVVDKEIDEDFRKALMSRGAYFVDSSSQRDMLKNLIFDEEMKVKENITGQSSCKIAKMAGFEVPKKTKILVAPLEGVGVIHPMSGRVLAPIIAYYVAEDFDSAVNLCIDLNYYGGVGHTVGIYSNDNEKIELFANQMDAGRVLVNTPSSMGAIGGIYNPLPPSFSLACGSGGRSITMDNVSIKHLMNIQRITRRRVNQRLRDFDKNIYFEENIDIDTLEKTFNKNF